MRVWMLFENNGRHVKGRLVAITPDTKLAMLIRDPEKHILEKWEIDTTIWWAVK